MRRSSILSQTLSLLGLMVAAGCYTQVPLAPTTQSQMTVTLTLTDQGRANLARTLGPEVSTVEGILSSRTDSTYVLSLSSVSYFNGGVTKWNGETQTIRTFEVRDATERHFSAGKTTIATVAAVAILVGAFELGKAAANTGGTGGVPVPNALKAP